MKRNYTPRAITENIVTQNIGDELLVYNLHTHRAMNLNSTAARIWELCDGKNTIARIGDLAAKNLKFAVPEEAVLLAIHDLAESGLVAEDNGEFAARNEMTAMTRRSMIRKVGMTAAVAIPVITAITAPRAAQAASANLLADGQSCTTDEQCLNACCLGNVCQPANACFI